VFFDKFVKLHQVGVVHVLERAKFALETEEGLGLGVGQRLQGDHVAVDAIAGFVDDTHSARSEPAKDLESATYERMLSTLLNHATSGNGPILYRDLGERPLDPSTDPTRARHARRARLRCQS